MDKVLLDTDILSEVLKAKNDVVVRNASAYQQEFGIFTTSAITITEMVKGFQKKGRDDLILPLTSKLARHEVLPLDREAAILAGRIYGELEKSGQPIGRADPLIAGIALYHGLTLVTGNLDHFQRITELGFPLSVHNWRA